VAHVGVTRPLGIVHLALGRDDCVMPGKFSTQTPCSFMAKLMIQAQGGPIEEGACRGAAGGEGAGKRGTEGTTSRCVLFVLCSDYILTCYVSLKSALPKPAHRATTPPPDTSFASRSSSPPSIVTNGDSPSRAPRAPSKLPQTHPHSAETHSQVCLS
jgi:hypothetical protein